MSRSQPTHPGGTPSRAQRLCRPHLWEYRTASPSTYCTCWGFYSSARAAGRLAPLGLESTATNTSFLGRRRNKPYQQLNSLHNRMPALPPRPPPPTNPRRGDPRDSHGLGDAVNTCRPVLGTHATGFPVRCTGCPTSTGKPRVGRRSPREGRGKTREGRTQLLGSAGGRAHRSGGRRYGGQHSTARARPRQHTQRHTRSRLGQVPPAYLCLGGGRRCAGGGRRFDCGGGLRFFDGGGLRFFDGGGLRFFGGGERRDGGGERLLPGGGRRVVPGGGERLTAGEGCFLTGEGGFTMDRGGGDVGGGGLGRMDGY